MAVYTDVTDEELQQFLAGYDLGPLLSYKGIAEGVENSNFLLHTAEGYFILTLYEKRVAAGDLPFFLNLMEHLAARGLTCPQPVRSRGGEALGRLAKRPAAIVTFLDGMWIRRPQCRPLRRGRRGSRGLHLAGADFSMTRRNGLSVAGWRPLFETPRAARRHGAAGTVRRRSRPSSRGSNAIGRATCRSGVIHADLFPDNVFFLGDRLSGLIDFYFACTDALRL